MVLYSLFAAGHRLWPSSCSGHNHQPLGNAAGWDGTDREAEVLQGPSHCRINVSMRGVLGPSVACMKHVVDNFLLSTAASSIIRPSTSSFLKSYIILVATSASLQVRDHRNDKSIISFTACTAHPNIMYYMCLPCRFEAITIPTLEATQAAVAACKQHYAALTQPQQPAGAEHNADAACMVGSVRSAGHNSLPAGADSHANSEAPAKDGFELAVAAQPRSWSPSSAEEVQRLSGLMAYCRSLSAARIRTDEIRQDEAGQQLVPVSDLSVRLQLSLQVTAGGAGAFGHVQILILMALLRASPSCSNGKVGVGLYVTGGS